MLGSVNGVHDMGGMHGFGPIRPRDNDEQFHAEWEKRIPGLRAAPDLAGIYTLDEMRHGIERMDPAHYLTASYYERHLFTFELNLIEKGVLSRDEIEARVEHLRSGAEPTRRDDPDLARRVVGARLQSEALAPIEPQRAGFRVGDRVRTRNVHPSGHTRLPRYARGKRGVITQFYGVETLPDASAHGRGPSPEPLYNVEFEATELWGAAADGRGSVHLDLWQSYLEPLEDSHE
jgi:nitrile hydratase beta subunit